MFYHYMELENSVINDTFSIKEIQDHFQDIQSITVPKNIKNFTFKSEFIYDISKIVINLNGTLRDYLLTLARVKLSTVPANCGSIFIHEVWTKYQRTKLGSLLLRMVEDWAIQAGYTMIHCNVPKYNNIDYTYKFFEKNGYKLMVKPYVNIRSNNINQWYYKILQLPREEDTP